MSSDFKVKIELHLAIPNYSNADIPLEQIANKFAVDARKNIRNQTNVDGSAFTRLSVKTIKDKKREGAAYPYRALYRKGIMYNAIHVYKRGKNVYEVGVVPRGKPRRDMVALIHQKVGPVIRTFLGLYPQSTKWAVDRINRWVKESTAKANKVNKQYNY